MNSFTKQIFSFCFPDYPARLKSLFSLVNPSSILDLGCGSSSPLQYVLPSTSVHRVGVDGFAPAIDASSLNSIHDEYIKDDLLHFASHTNRRFDVVILSDVLEHFAYDDALALLRHSENLANKLIVLITPFGFVPQGSLLSNPWQVHKSGFFPNDFRVRGFKVEGIGGFRFLRGSIYKPILRPERFGEIVCNLSWAPGPDFCIRARGQETEGPSKGIFNR